MTSEGLAWWVGPVNGLLAPATRRGCRSPGPSFAALEERAARRAGVTGRAGPADPQEAQFAGDLRVLYESFLAARELSFSGLFGARLEVFRHLRNGLRVRALMRAHPEIARAPVRQPVFVTGLPRTGTTALHALLAGVPGHRAPLMWELLEPCPPDAGRRRHPAPAQRRVDGRRRLPHGPGVPGHPPPRGGTPLPFAGAAALLAGLAVVLAAVAARTTVRRDIA